MKNTITTIVTLLLTLVLISPLVSAGMNGNHRDDPWEKPQGSEKTINGENRLLMYKVWDDGITVTSMGKDHNQFNAFYFTLTLDKGVFMHYNYFRTSSSDEAGDFHDRVAGNRTFPENGHRPPPPQGNQVGKESLEDLGFSVLMKKLREFNETDHSVSIYNFGNVDFNKPMVKLIKEGNTITGLEIRTATEDDVFALTFYIVSTSEFGEERGMTPYEVKYDVIITDYPFKTSDSSLALENIFALPQPFQDEPGERKFDEKPLPSDWSPQPKERTLGYDLESLSMFFSWATNVTVDGEDHNVTAEYTVSVDGDSTRVEGMTFYYPQGQSILHDPTIGVADLLEIAEDATEFIELLISWSTGLGIGVVLIAAVAVRMKPAKFDWED